MKNLLHGLLQVVDEPFHEPQQLRVGRGALRLLKQEVQLVLLGMSQKRLNVKKGQLEDTNLLG